MLLGSAIDIRSRIANLKTQEHSCVNNMYNRLFIAFLVIASPARGQSWWDAIGSAVSGVTSLVGTLTTVHTPEQNEDAYLTIQQLAGKYGYPLETHTVTTQDGYILNMHRIPNGRNATRNGRVVFLMHGIWESSDSWLLQGPRNSLGYILADAGFDVWMGNARGNRHTLQHRVHSPSSSEFWEFSWEEIGRYDLPAMIDYIVNLTGENKIFYVGFSQGTTSFFVMTSMRPEYNDKIKLMFAMAPEVYMGNAQNILLRIFSPAHSLLQFLLWNFNVYSPSLDFFNMINPLVCNILPVRCDNFFFSIVGRHHVKETLWPVILGHVPTGSSTLQFVHYGQLAHSRRFCRFDFGRRKNGEKYGQEKPPDYKLDAVTAPVVLLYSGNDWFSDLRDVDLLKKTLPRVAGSYLITHFTHVDFMYAEDASTYVYPNIVKHIRSKV